MKTRQPTWGNSLFAIAAGAAIFAAPRLASANFSCQVGFQDSTGLGLIDPGTSNYVGMKGGILTPSCQRDAMFHCINSNQLWYYELCNGLIWLYFDENTNTAYGHFHQPAEDPTIGTCYTQDSSGAFVFGRLQQNFSCSSAGIDPVHTARFILMHQPDQWIRVINASNSWLFRPSVILVEAGSAPVHVAFTDSNNTFWVYSNLAPGPNGTWWTLNPTGTFGSVAFAGTDVGSGEGTFDNWSFEVVPQ